MLTAAHHYYTKCTVPLYKQYSIALQLHNFICKVFFEETPEISHCLMKSEPKAWTQLWVPIMPSDFLRVMQPPAH